MALVATLASVMPATPFVFRNYEVGPELRGRMQEVRKRGGVGFCSAVFLSWPA